jgi:hypothetical protein
LYTDNFVRNTVIGTSTLRKHKKHNVWKVVVQVLVNVTYTLCSTEVQFVKERGLWVRGILILYTEYIVNVGWLSKIQSHLQWSRWSSVDIYHSEWSNSVEVGTETFFKVILTCIRSNTEHCIRTIQILGSLNQILQGTVLNLMHMQ